MLRGVAATLFVLTGFAIFHAMPGRVGIEGQDAVAEKLDSTVKPGLCVPAKARWHRMMTLRTSVSPGLSASQRTTCVRIQPDG